MLPDRIIWLAAIEPGVIGATVIVCAAGVPTGAYVLFVDVIVTVSEAPKVAEDWIPTLKVALFCPAGIVTVEGIDVKLVVLPEYDRFMVMASGVV